MAMKPASSGKVIPPATHDVVDNADKAKPGQRAVREIASQQDGHKDIAGKANGVPPAKTGWSTEQRGASPVVRKGSLCPRRRKSSTTRAHDSRR